MHDHYQCACCKQMLPHQEKTCSQCGSHIQHRPLSFWLLCLMAGLATTILFNAIHLYLSTPADLPMTANIFDSLSQVIRK